MKRFLMPQMFLAQKICLGKEGMQKFIEKFGKMVRSRKPTVRSESRRIQVHPADAAGVAKRSSSHDDLQGFKFKMEKVTILRRGESLDSKMNEKGGLAGTRTARLRPRPEMVQNTDMYAGSAFAVSLEPSSLPLPSFSRKKQVLKVVDDDSATQDLRRLLRLD